MYVKRMYTNGIRRRELIYRPKGKNKTDTFKGVTDSPVRSKKTILPASCRAEDVLRCFYPIMWVHF
jgi:hypothetical protein